MPLKKFFNHYFFWVLNYFLISHPSGAFREIDSVNSSLANVKKSKPLYGSVEWRYKNKLIGHIHGNRIVDIIFPKEIQSNLLLAPLIAQNKYAKNAISIYLRTYEDIDFSIKILTQSYNLIKSKTDKHETV